MQTDLDRPFWRSRWWIPAFSAGLGLVVFSAFAIGGDLADGVIGFGVMALFGLVFLVGGRRSETLAGLGGPGRDERWAMIDIRATAFAGLIVLVAIIAAWLYEIANGRDGSPYGQLAALSGIAYIAAIVFQRLRS